MELQYWIKPISISSFARTKTSFYSFIRLYVNDLVIDEQWDSRSQSFEYEFRLIAREVKKRDLDVKLAKVFAIRFNDDQINLPSNRQIAEIYHIRNFPSLHLFQNGDNTHYDGRLHKRYIQYLIHHK